jgi:hypothetical protein
MVELVVFCGSPQVELMVFRGSPILNHGSHIGVFLGTSSKHFFDHTPRISTHAQQHLSKDKFHQTRCEYLSWSVSGGPASSSLTNVENKFRTLCAGLEIGCQ